MSGKQSCCKYHRETNSYNFCPECGMNIKEWTRPKPIEPTVKETGYGEIEESHPAYGQLGFSRRTGNKEGAVTLYGSTIRHQNTITLTVSRSKKSSNEFSERYHTAGCGQALIEVEMSQSQFSEAITSMNMGSGVPVTIRTVMGKSMPECTELTLRQKADRNLKSRYNKVANKIEDQFKRIRELTERKGTLKASEKKELLDTFNYFLMEIKSNLPFLKECTDEIVDASILQAKDEVESFWLQKINSLGIEKLEELVEQHRPLISDK